MAKCKRIKHAYSSLYIDEVMGNVGELFQYADIEFEVTLEELLKLWIPSIYCKGIEDGRAHFMVGMTGREVAMELFKVEDTRLKWAPALEEYWIGWASAYLQWYCNISFERLYELVPISRFRLMYPAYHCMDLSHLEIFAKEEILVHPDDVWFWDESSYGYKPKERVVENVKLHGKK